MRLPSARDGGAVLLLALLALLLLRKAVLGGVLFERDVHLVWLPQMEVLVRAVAGGAWPLWNPSAGFGDPLLANPEAQVLYPFTWLNLICPPATFYTLFAVAHLILGGRAGAAGAGGLRGHVRGHHPPVRGPAPVLRALEDPFVAQEPPPGRAGYARARAGPGGLRGAVDADRRRGPSRRSSSPGDTPT